MNAVGWDAMIGVVYETMTIHVRCPRRYTMQVSPGVLALYNIIETNFRPMSIVKDSMPHLETLSKAGGDLARSASKV